jgi:hypothetical protein
MKPQVYNSTSNPIVTMNFDVSTGHITAQDNVLLKKAVKDPEAPVIVYEYKEGYFVYVPIEGNEFDETEGPAMEKYGLSKTFINLLRETARLKCKYLQLDADGMEYENLPTFEW